MLKAKNKKGITLVSLVVTIIILIILAGVSINMLLGESGIITKAKEAAKLQEIATIKEEIRLKILEQEMETQGTITQEKIETILSNYGTVNKNEDGTIKSLTPTGKNYEIAYEEIYTIVEIGDDTNNDKDSSSDTVTITREEYNRIIERLDALDGGSKSSISVADVSSNMNSMQENINVSISDINSNLEWKSIGSVTGKEIINLPNDFEELCILIVYDSKVFEHSIPKIALSSTSRRFEGGNAIFQSTTSFYAYTYAFNITETSYNLISAQSNCGSTGNYNNYTESAKSTIYYR